MRLAVLGISHETNTFSPLPTDDAAFEHSGIGGVHYGEQLWERFADSGQTTAGFADARHLPGVEIVPIGWASANPGATISAGTFERLARRQLELLARSGPFDGVLLSQHGAMVAEGFPDADAEYIRRVRAVVGEGVVVGNVMDTHGNVSQEQVAAADITLLWQTNPHVDCRERGLQCATLVARTVRGEIVPVTAVVRPRIVAPILAQNTSDPPMADLLAEARSLVDAEPALLDVSIGEGFPYADVPQLGMTVVATADGDAELARRTAARLARSIWSVRQKFEPRAMPIADAVRLRPEPDAGPVLLLDVGDNIGGGSPGDSTFLYEALLRERCGGYLINLYDPQAVAGCERAGIGSRVQLMVGGKSDSLHGTPQPVIGTFKVLSDGRFRTHGPVHGGHPGFDAGRTAVVEADDGATVILTTNPMMTTSVDMPRSVGVEPTRFARIVAKGVMSPQLSYGPISSRIVYVDTPGSTAADPARFDYRARPRPLFPIERDIAQPWPLSPWH